MVVYINELVDNINLFLLLFLDTLHIFQVYSELHASS